MTWLHEIPTMTVVSPGITIPADPDAAAADTVLQDAIDRALTRIRRGLPREYVAGRLARAIDRADTILNRSTRQEEFR